MAYRPQCPANPVFMRFIKEWLLYATVMKKQIFFDL